MADGYDRYDREEHESGGGSFMMGLLTGTVLGAGLGMLFAPKSGTELRHKIGEQANTFGRAAGEQYRRASDAASGIVDKASGMVDKARERFDETRERVGRAAEGVRDEAVERFEQATDYATSSGGSTYTGGTASGFTSEPRRPDRS